MSTVGLTIRSPRYTFLGLIAWLSVCLLVGGIFPQQAFSFGSFWTIAGLFGLVSAVGLSQAVKSELSAQKELLRSYVTEARTDALTGLGNRRAFDADIEDCETNWRKGNDFSLLLIDVDHFKSFNDSFGHQAGDEMLRSVAAELKEQTKEAGFATRYGGEEFAVMLPNADLKAATSFAETLRQILAAQEARYRSSVLKVTVSIGVAQAKSNEKSRDLVVRADQQLYDAKKSGRNCVRPEVPLAVS